MIFNSKIYSISIVALPPNALKYYLWNPKGNFKSL
jgi:hypothetical protein